MTYALFIRAIDFNKRALLIYLKLQCKLIVIMCIIKDDPILIDDREKPPTFYQVRSVHRRHGNSEKSIWTISIPEEIECFRYSYSLSWLEKTQGWGLKISSSDQLEEVGKSDQGISLKIAKFRDDKEDKIWHGYPANYREKIQDKPPETILAKWMEAGFINKVQKSRIVQRKPCNL